MYTIALICFGENFVNTPHFESGFKLHFGIVNEITFMKKKTVPFRDFGADVFAYWL